MIRLLLCLLILASSLYGFDVQNARAIIDELGSDAYAGRRPGHPGGTKAEEYLAAKLQAYGLKPAGRSGFMQDVPMLVTKEEAASLTLMNHELGKIPLVLGADFTLVTNSGSGSFMAKVVIAGMGYNRPDKGRDDYGDLDCRNRIVVILRDFPDSPYSFQEDHSRGRTLAWAKEKGATAVIWYDRAFPVQGAAILEQDYDPNIPMFYIGDQVLSLLLDGSGYSLKTYKNELKKRPVPVDTGYEMWVSARTKKLSGAAPRNVVGIVYGNDPVLKNEVIVVGAHMDHVGENAKGVIYNGADDNASGSGLLSELAHSIATGPALKRSVMFIHFTGEEDGLLGSTCFVNDPTIPFGNIACMLNFDMVGQGYGVVGTAGGHQLGAPWYEYLDSLTPVEAGNLKFYREDGYAASDNGPFMQSGVPTLSFWSSGDHPFYHRYTDDPQNIVDSVLTNVGNRAESFIQFIANYSESLASRSDSLRNIARTAATLNMRGFFVDPSGTMPKLATIAAAWLPHDSDMPVSEITARTAEVHYVCKERKLSSTGLADAVNGFAHDKLGVFLAIPEASFVGRTPPEAITLVHQGLSLVSLVPGNGKSGGKMSDEIQQILLDGGLYAEVPLDFGTPSRIATWKDHAIVTARLADFAAVPTDIRESLLTSDALLVLEVEPDMSKEQIEAIRSGRQRQVHLNFGSSYPELRENEMKSAIRKLYDAGLSRDDVLLLTGGNLRRFFKS